MKYWFPIPLLYLFAFILDPRSKLNGLSNLISYISTCFEEIDYTSEYTNARDKFFEVYSVYEAKFGSNQQQQHTPPQENEEHLKNKSFWSMIGSRPQGRGRGSSSTSSSSSQPLPPINPQQSSDLTQYIE